jgi:anti-anti-sigma factor
MTRTAGERAEAVEGTAGANREGRPGPSTGELVLVAVGYYVAARLSLRLSLVDEVVTPIWPPTGIALVALLRYGPRVWPGITVAAFAVNVPLAGWVPGAVIAAGNTLAPLLAARLLRAAGFRRELDRLRDALALVSLGALTAMTVSATVGTAALWLAGIVPGDALAATWSVWWAGDATGILIFAPLLLSIRRPRLASGRRTAEAAVVFLALAATAYLGFRSSLGRPYLLFPLVIWATVRFGQLGASVAALVVVAMAVWAAIERAGPFAPLTLLGRALTLQVYNAGAALTSFLLAAVMTERQKAQADLEEAADVLEERVREVQALLERERRIAETLQRSLLPQQLPQVPGVALAGRYLPGAAGLEVGGDWYDVFVVPGGRVGLTIGDVVGRGLTAAAAMGQLRTGLRAYALETPSPATVLERLNRLVQELETPEIATIIYAVLDPETGRLHYAVAGHPPPLLAAGDGTARYLPAESSPPLGVSGEPCRDEVVTLEPGSTLVLYTDGLVERRDRSIDDGLEALRGALAGAADDLDALCDDRILGILPPDAPADDVAVLAVRFLPVVGDELDLLLPAEPEVLASLRRALGQWLTGHGGTPEEVHDLVLACNEAATNVLEHAYGPGEGFLEIKGRHGGDDVEVTVRDFGRWRSPRGDERGRGLLLMHALVDSLEVVPAASGTEVRLRRRLGRAEEAAGARQPAASLPRAHAPREEDLVKVVHLDDIDVSNAHQLRTALLNGVSNEALGLVVDLSGARHIDSAGIRLLFQLAARLGQRRQQLGIVVPEDSSIRRVLLLTKLDTAAWLSTTVEEATARTRSLVEDAPAG